MGKRAASSGPKSAKAKAKQAKVQPEVEKPGYVIDVVNWSLACL